MKKILLWSFMEFIKGMALGIEILVLGIGKIEVINLVFIILFLIGFCTDLYNFLNENERELP